MHTNLDEICNVIEDTRSNIFEYNLNAVFMNIDKLILAITDYIEHSKMPKDKMSEFNDILENIIQSLDKKDYLLVSDILIYNLKKFLENL